MKSRKLFTVSMEKISSLEAFKTYSYFIPLPHREIYRLERYFRGLSYAWYLVDEFYVYDMVGFFACWPPKI